MKKNSSAPRARTSSVALLSPPRRRVDADVIEVCKAAAAAGWARIHRGPFWSHLRAHGLDRELYRRLMAQIFHYTRHNAQNQALAAVRVGSERLDLLRFCLAHALEEAGHDLMVLHDLKADGAPSDWIESQPPLPETQALVSYLYQVATTRDATARLGYSFWAESCYDHIAELLDAMHRDLGLKDAQMTFFVGHARIDADHFDHVCRVVRAHASAPALRADLLEVLSTSLHLTGAMLDAVHASSAQRAASRTAPPIAPAPAATTSSRRSRA